MLFWIPAIIGIALGCWIVLVAEPRERRKREIALAGTRAAAAAPLTAAEEAKIRAEVRASFGPDFFNPPARAPRASDLWAKMCR